MQWTFDPAHSQIQFSVRHMGISTVRGTFGQFAGSIEDSNGVVKGVTVDIDVASSRPGTASVTNISAARTSLTLPTTPRRPLC